jgi:beta-lactamase regulating signal transducer with metallopeptidase domain
MNSIAEIAATYLTNALWMTCVVAAVTVLLSRALRRCPASYRHVLWVAALLLAVLLPSASLRGSRTDDEPTHTPVGTSSMVQAGTLPSGGYSWLRLRGMRHDGQPIQFGPFWVGLVAMLYLGFISYRAVRLYRGWRSLQAMLGKSIKAQIPSRMGAVVERCHALLGVEPIPILFSLEGGPATLGIRNPVLVLPEWLLAKASEEELSSTLGHELAHVRRRDFLLNLAYEIVMLPICFHPAAALIKNHVDQTRELACDEIAAESLSMGAQYARSLLSIAQSMAANQRPTTVAYALGLFDTNTLEERIMNVVAKANRFRKSWARASAIGAWGLLIATCLGVSGLSIQVTQAQSRDADLQPFVGTWQAKFKGKVFETIKLEKKQGKLTGTVSHADVNVDPKTGELGGVTVHDGSDAIVEAKLKGGILRITEEDDVQFDMKITEPGQAQLQVVMPPDGLTVKPWKLERVAGQ